jgi:hypothetical protein
MGTKQPEKPKETTSTATGTSEETGADQEDTRKTGMRPTGSGGSAPPSENR